MFLVGLCLLKCFVTLLKIIIGEQLMQICGCGRDLCYGRDFCGPSNFSWCFRKIAVLSFLLSPEKSLLTHPKLNRTAPPQLSACLHRAGYQDSDRWQWLWLQPCQTVVAKFIADGLLMNSLENSKPYILPNLNPLINPTPIIGTCLWRVKAESRVQVIWASDLGLRAPQLC